MEQKCLYMPKLDGMEETVLHCRYKSKYLCDGCSLPLCMNHTTVKLIFFMDYETFNHSNINNFTPFRLYLCLRCKSTKNTDDIFEDVKI